MVGNIGAVFIKQGEGVGGWGEGVAPLCQLCKETLKISHPPIIKQPPHSWLPPFLVKISHPPITATSEKSHPPLYERGWGWGGRTMSILKS